MTAIKLYDLAGADPARRFSPFCWRTKLAILHKELEFDAVPWRFTEREALAFSGQGRVPVIVDAEETVFDSWAIAQYLETRYPERPSLFGGATGMATTRFVNAWADKVLHPALAALVLIDIYAHIRVQDQDYFRTSREKVFGKTIEQVSEGREAKLPAFRQILEPVRTVLQSQSYLAGARPAYADYIVFGAFQWARCISSFKLLDAADPVAVWRASMLEAFGGIAGAALGYPV